MIGKRVYATRILPARR